MFKDNHDPVLFDAALYETANMTVLHCREVLEKTGMTEEATRLQGVEVTDRHMAEVALDILKNLKASAETVYARDTAVTCLRSTLRS